MNSSRADKAFAPPPPSQPVPPPLPPPPPAAPPVPASASASSAGSSQSCLRSGVAWNESTSWSTVLQEINAAAEVGDSTAALRIFEAKKHLVPSKRDTVLYNTVLKAFANAADSAGAEEWHGRMLDDSVRLNSKTFGKLMEAAAKSGNLQKAEAFFRALEEEKSLELSQVSYQILLDACAKSGNVEASRSWLRRLRAAGYRPDSIAYNCAIRSCAAPGHLEQAEAWLTDMQREGVEPTLTTYNSLLHCYSTTKDLIKPKQLINQMIERSIKPDEITYTSLIDCCANQGAWQEALVWLGCCPTPSNVAINAALNACAKSGQAAAVDHLLEALSSRSGSPDIVALTSLIEVAAADTRVKLDLENVLQRLQRSGVSPDETFFNRVLDVLASKGDVQGVEHGLSRMTAATVEPNVVSFNTLLKAYASKGDGAGARALLDTMQTRSMQPTIVSFNSVARACSQSGNVMQVQQLFQQMEDCGLTPDVQSYTAFFVACARRKPSAGREAEQMLHRLAKDKPVVLDKQLLSSARRALGDRRSKKVFRQLGLD